jgi:hypothetical protein
MKSSGQILEAATQRKQMGAERAKQQRDRVGDRAADGGVRRISHTVHTSRKQDAAAAKEVTKPPKRRWQRASMLPAMPELPGYHVEYVRRDNRHRGDHANLSAHLRSGWELARASDFELANLPTITIAAHGEVIGNDDTVLMKIEEDMWAERTAEYDGVRDAATRAINRKVPTLDVQHPSLPVDPEHTVNRSSSGFQRVGIKRRGQVAPDTD